MKKNKSHVIRVYNNSRQLIQLQARPPGGNFYTNESQVRIPPGQDVLLPKTHLRQDQLENLKKKGFIKILHDSEAIAERAEMLASQ
jgi:hypothetical protein